MKKVIILLIFILISLSQRAYASAQFDEVLSGKISGYGVFENGQGVVYAGEKNFENRTSLFIVYVTSSAITCEVYDDSDGIQLTDSLDIPYGADSAFRLAAVTYGGRDYLMLKSGTSNEFFAMQNDAFTRVEGFNYDTIQYIAGVEQGKAVSFVSPVSVHNFLNTLKEKTIARYTFVNRINSLSPEDAAGIRAVLSACADIMRFDIKDYDYDTLFKYVLYTHKNFQILTDLPAGSSSSSSLGYNDVSIVNSDFIDFVMKNIFRVTPEKPPVNNLLSRGFCYSDGYYYYTGGFDVYFATQFGDIAAVYDLGGGVMFVVFTDVYYEGNRETPEYSFAVLQKTGGTYSLLRLGMGENLPEQSEVRQYSPFSTYGNSSWSSGASQEHTGTLKGELLLPVLLLIVSVGVVGLVCSVVVFIRTRR